MENMEYDPQELLPIVAELSRKYTGGEHSSVTWERAQALMEAVMYCIWEYENSAGEGRRRKEDGTPGGEAGAAVSAGKGIPAQEAYRQGAILVVEKVKKLRVLYNELASGFCDFGVRCLGDTVRKGMPAFFLSYDARFAPQETLLMLDYPVLRDISSLSGVDAVWEYMQCIRLEQKFLQGLDHDWVVGALAAYHEEYRELMENICGIVLERMAICAALGRPFDPAGSGRQDWLRERRETGIWLEEKSGPESEQWLLAMVREAVKRFAEDDPLVYEYLAGGVREIAGRLRMLYGGCPDERDA